MKVESKVEVNTELKKPRRRVSPFFKVVALVQDEKIVAIAYKLHVDGALYESVSSQAPFEYLHGGSNILTALEKVLQGKSIGETVEVKLLADQAFGDYDEDSVEVVPRSDFVFTQPGINIEVGQQVQLVDSEGNLTNYVVTRFDDAVVVLDPNHQLAGKQLSFTIEVVGIREPSASERDRGVPNSLDSRLGVVLRQE